MLATKNKYDYRLDMLKLEDLKPAEATFTLSNGKTYVLKAFSLAERIRCKHRFGDQMGKIFKTQDIEGIAEITFMLLKDNSEYKTFMDFAAVIVSIKDQITITKALLETIGIDDAVINSLSKEADQSPNGESPNLK